MAKKKKKPNRGCIIGTCPRAPKDGARVCPDHLHPLRLQDEIVRLRSTREGGWEDLLAQFPDLRRLGETLAVLSFRADPMKGGSVAVVARGRGHNQDDGIVALGDHIVRPGYAAGTKRDEGRLGAAVAKVRDVARQLERIVDPEEASGSDTRIRCGSRKCSKPNHRQPADTSFCRFCGRQLSERDPVKSEAAKRPRAKAPRAEEPRAEEPTAAPTEPDESHETSVRAPEPAPEREGAIKKPEKPPNGHRELVGHRIITVDAASIDQACTAGLDMAKSVFTGLNVAGVLRAEPMPGETDQWKVTVRVS